jgi:class 3 adenylate cyclase
MQATANTEPIRLLVVDDEPDVKSLFELRFRREIKQGAMVVHFAGNGRDALEMVHDDPDIEVVVTDLNMPGMSGLELLGHLERVEWPLKTIVLTAYGDMANIRNAMMHGAFDFQVKPLDIDDLRATIDKASATVRELRAGRVARREAEALERRNRHLTEIFGKYVSDDVVTQLLSSEDGIELAGENRELTLLFADIRGFSRLAKELPADQVITLLNGYLEVATDRILERGGTINEILGDGLLVYFGAPMADDASAEHAVAAALELQLAMRELNVRHRASGLPELAIGIAIHTGEAVVGSIGSARRLKYAAVGPNVNLVAGMEAHARGGQVVVSQTTYERVRDIAVVNGSFTMVPKGSTDAQPLYVVRGLRGTYQLDLPLSHDPMHSVAGLDGSIARVVNDRPGHDADCAVVALGRRSARVRTALTLAPLDDVVVRIAEVELYGKVSECAVIDDEYVLTVVYNTAAGEVLDQVIDEFADRGVTRTGRAVPRQRLRAVHA